MSNILITFLSAIYEDPKKPKEELEYDSDSNVKISGKYTNDAPAKYFLYKSDGLDKIICLVTSEAKASYDKFSSMITDECHREELKKPEIIPVDYVDTAVGINKSLDKINSLTDTGDHIYLDITGGFRHANYMIMLMMKFADFTNKKITVDQVIYSSIRPEKINDITDIYKLFDLMNGAQNFMSFGNSDLLADYFKNNHQTDERIVNLIKCMQDFSEAVILCKTKKLDGIMERMNCAVDHMAEVKNNDDKGTMFFKKIVDVVADRFSISRDGGICYPEIIKWCVQNNLIQQALTLYVEKMPKYLINDKTGVIKASKTEREEAVKNKGVYDEDYKLFFEGFMSVNDADDSYVKSVSDFIRKNSLQIVQCSSSEEFSEACADKNMPIHFTELLDNLYVVKKCTYSENGGRYSDEEIKNNYKGNEGLEKVISTIESNPGSFKKFINIIPSQKELLKILHNDYLITSYAHNEAESDKKMKQTHSPLKKIYTARNIERILDYTDIYSLKGVTAEKISRFMLDYLYIKQYLRNTINHAADESSLAENVLNAFGNLGYKIESENEEIKTNYIKELVINSLDALKL